MSTPVPSAEAEELRALAKAIKATDFAAVRLAFACGGTAKTVRESLLPPSFFCNTVASSKDTNGSNISANIDVRAGHLVGILRADGAGGLYLCDVDGAAAATGNAADSVPDAVLSGEARLVVAPPLAPCFRDALIYAKSWRRVPLVAYSHSRTSDCPGVYEILFSDLHILSNGAASACPKDLLVRNVFVPLRDIKPKPRSLVNVIGRVRCKSNVLASRKSPFFLVELGSCADNREEDVLAMIFDGLDAVRWWPFIRREDELCFIGLSVVSLPSKAGRRVLRARGRGVGIAAASGSSVVNEYMTHGNLSVSTRKPQSDIHGSAPPQKRSYAKMVEDHPTRTGTSAQSLPRRRLVSYKGEITEVMTDGRFMLDNSVMLHLGAYGGWCAGPEAVSLCFRKGAEIVVSEALVARRRGRAVALFPTARSDAHVIYFGSLPSCCPDLTVRLPFRESPWRALWKDLSSSEVLWAEELYSYLRQKFGLWCQSQVNGAGNASSNAFASDFRIVEALLGSKTEDGLVRHIMQMHAKLTKRKGSAARTRDVYDEFICAGEIDFSSEGLLDRGDFPIVPSILQIIQACRYLYSLSRAHCGGLVSGNPGEKALSLEGSTIGYFAQLSGDIGRIIAHGEDVSIQTSKSEGAPVLDAEKAKVSQVENIFNYARPSLTFPLDRKSILHQSGSAWTRQETTTDLIGCLDSTIDSQGGLCLFDATGYLYALPMGPLSPRFLGAVVRIPFFAIVRVSDNISGVTWSVIFDASSIEAVIAREFEPMSSKTLSRMQAESQYAIRKEHARPPTIVQSQKYVAPLSSSMSDKAPDRRPVVAIYVTEVMVQTAGNNWSSFTLRGRLLAMKPSRSERYWCYLGDGKRGFLECMLCVSGGLATPLHAMVECGRVYEITCTELSEVPDVLSFLWQRALAPAVEVGDCRSDCILHEVHLNTIDEDSRIWLYPLDAAEFACLHETEEEQSVVEAAVESWQSGGGVANSRESPVVDVSSLFSLTNRRDSSSLIRLRGILIKTFAGDSRHLPPESRDSECAAIGMFILRDAVVPVAEVGVKVDDDVILPEGLLPGTLVELSGVRLTAAVAHDDFRLSVSKMSSLRLVSDSLISLGESWPSICCQRPLASYTVLAAFPVTYLHSFTQAGRCALRNSQLVGCISVTIKRITSVKLFVKPTLNESALCNFCEEGGFELQGELLADVADGTASGCMVSYGVRNVLEALSASEYDTMLLRRALLEEKYLSYDFDLSNVKLHAPRVAFCDSDDMSTQRDLGSKLLHRLTRNAPRNVVVVSRFDPKETDGAIFNLTGIIDLGRGNKLPTAVHGDGDRASIECLAVLENSAWRNPRLPSQDSAVSAVDMIHGNLNALTK